MRAIIPCAGFGTRMNMPPDQSKEMLIDVDNGRPLIDYALYICWLFGLHPLIVTRKEKMDLIRYVGDKCEVQIIEPEGEWPTTVLKSQDYWHEENLLILPDTRFSPINIIEEMRLGLRNPRSPGNYAVAYHRVDDPDKWGILKNDCGSITLYEKPKHLGAQQFAWGLFAWKRAAGAHLFSGDPVIVLGSIESFRLKSFRDITRAA